MSGDALQELADDHADLDRRIHELGAQIRGAAASDGSLRTSLEGLRDVLFRHFAREEEAAFPFLVATLPELEARLDAMASAHDTICNTLARLCELARTHPASFAVAALFERFVTTYASHANQETELLRELETRLAGGHRAHLAELMRDL